MKGVMLPLLCLQIRLSSWWNENIWFVFNGDAQEYPASCGSFSECGDSGKGEEVRDLFHWEEGAAGRVHCRTYTMYCTVTERAAQYPPVWAFLFFQNHSPVLLFVPLLKVCLLRTRSMFTMLMNCVLTLCRAVVSVVVYDDWQEKTAATAQNSFIRRNKLPRQSRFTNTEQIQQWKHLADENMCCRKRKEKPK